VLSGRCKEKVRNLIFSVSGKALCVLIYYRYVFKVLLTSSAFSDICSINVQNGLQTTWILDFLYIGNLIVSCFKSLKVSKYLKNREHCIRHQTLLKVTNSSLSQEISQKLCSEVTKQCYHNRSTSSLKTFNSKSCSPVQHICPSQRNTTCAFASALLTKVS